MRCRGHGAHITSSIETKSPYLFQSSVISSLFTHIFRPSKLTKTSNDIHSARNIYRPHSKGMEKVMFLQVGVCPLLGGVPPSSPMGVGWGWSTPIQPNRWLPEMGVPHQAGWGTPPGLDRCTPPIRLDGGYLLLGWMGVPGTPIR